MTVSEPRWIKTERLDIVQLSLRDVELLVDSNPESVERLLQAKLPRPFAPPPLMSDALPTVCAWLHDHPGDHWWQPWFFADRASKTIVGSAGFSGPSESGSLQLGYSVYAEYQGRGYASEAARALVERTWSDPNIRAVQATIPPWHATSIRVAEKLGMRVVGTGTDDEVGKILIYEIRRPAGSSQSTVNR